MGFPSLHILLSFAVAVLMAGCTRIAAPEDSGEGGAASSERPHTKKLSGYPYYAYVEPDWQYEEWVSEVVDSSGMLDTVKSSVHTDPEFKQTSGYSCNFLKPSKTLPEDQYGCYQFSHYRGENHVISMDAEEGAEIPSMRVFREGDDVLVEGIALDGRWYFPVASEMLDSSAGRGTVKFYNSDLSIYDIPRHNITIKDAGAPYSFEFTANLVVAGKYMGTTDNASVELLAERLKDRLNLALNPGGITVREVNVLYASEHPLVGHFFNDGEAEPLDHSGERDSINALGRWPGHEGEINFVLGYYVEDGETTKGFSPMPGEIYMGGSAGGHISIVTHIHMGEENVSSRALVDVAVHELGHFFGLRHTSEIPGTDDGIDDTPFCEDSVHADTYWLCPDYGYILGPFSVDYYYASFTPQQMDVIRRYLESTPHR